MDQLTIVMVEDDEGHASLIERNIKRAGVCNPILWFPTAQEGIAFLNGAAGPLLVLLDLNLPDASGIEVLSYMKSHPTLKRTPVVILTTTDDETEIKRCYDLGCNVYITKPVDYLAFSDAIRQLGLFLSVIQVPAAK